MNNTLKILRSNFEHVDNYEERYEYLYWDLRIAVTNAMDELNQYRNGYVTDDSLIKTLTELIEEINNLR